MEHSVLTIDETQQLIRKGRISPVELVRTYLERINSFDRHINSFVFVNADNALKRAAESEVLIRKGEAGILSGIPMAIKDNLCTREVKTTCCSRILENFIPPYESTVTSRLGSEGYILLGKTNLDEFAMGSSTENSAFGVTKNPWDLTSVPGGSSGGSTSAVAADLCAAALGSDTGGSIRQPASLCGVVGLKPTYGRVSRFGLIAFASSLDQVGPITKTVKDAAILLNIISGWDPMDSTSIPGNTPDFTTALKKGVKGLKIGIPSEYLIPGMDSEVNQALKDAIKTFESLGAIAVDISLPHSEYGVAAYYILATSEASSNLARYDGVKYGLRKEGRDLQEMYLLTRGNGFGPEVKRRIMLGTYALSSGYYEAYYKKAQQVRTLIINDFQRAFKEVDVIASATSPTPAFKIGEKTDNPLQMYLSDIFTLPANLAGIPAISLPCGFTKNNLPVGLQLMGPHCGEETILQAAYAYEQATEWYKLKPGLTEGK